MAGSEGGGPRPPPALLVEERPPLPEGAPEALDQEIAPEAEAPDDERKAGTLPDLVHPNRVPSDDESDQRGNIFRSVSAPIVGSNGEEENGEQQQEAEEQEKPNEEQPQSMVIRKHTRRVRQETGESLGSTGRRIRQETGESLSSTSRHVQRTESCEGGVRRNNPIMKVHSEAPRQKLSPAEATRQILSSRSSRAGCSTDSCGSALTRGVASSQPSSFRSGIIGGCHSYASGHPSDYPIRTKLSELGVEFERLSRDFTTAQAENTKLRQELRRLRLTITERDKEEPVPGESQGQKGQNSLDLADMRNTAPKDRTMTMGRVLSMGGTLFGRTATETPPGHAQRRGSGNSGQGHFARLFAGRGGAAASVQPARHSTSSMENPQFHNLSSGDDAGRMSGEDGAIQFKVTPNDDFPASTAPRSSFSKDKPKPRGSKTSVASSSNKNWPFSLGSNPPESVGSAAEGQEKEEDDEMVVQAQGSDHTFSGSGEAELESGAGGADGMVKHRSLKTIFKGISNFINTSSKASDDKLDKVENSTVLEGRCYASIVPEFTEKAPKEERSVSLFPEYFSPSRDEDAVLNGMDSCHYSAYSMSTEYSEYGDMRKPMGVLAPMGRCRMLWDFLALVCFMFEFWAIPFHLAFLQEFPEPMAVMMHCVTAVFVMDILLNFSTGYIENSSTVMLRAPIAWRYLRTWFLWDLLATVPFQLIAASFSLTRLIRILKLPRLLKNLRYVRIMPALESLLLGRQTASAEGSGFPGRCLLKYVVRMAAVLTTIALTAHVNGCVRWALLMCDRAVPAEGERWPQDAGGDFYAALRCYYESFWWAYTALTIGRTEDSMGSAKIWAFEVVVASERLFFLALMGIWAVQEAMVYHESDARLQVLEENAMLYLKQHNISFKTRLQVLSSLDETRSSTELQRNFDTFVESFPEEVRRKIAEEMWSKKLLSLDLIRVIMEWQREFVKELAAIVREEIMATKTVVCHEGDASIAAYMVLRGELRIIVRFASAPIPNFTQGMWVGEKALVNPGLRRSATVMSVTMSSLMAVPAERFQELLSRFNLRGKFEELCEDHLWKGLCGRCGSLGSHFSDACPHLGMGGLYAATRRRRMRFIDRTMSMGTAGTSFEAASDEDISEPILHRVSSRKPMKAVKNSVPLERTLTEFLKLHNLHRLVPVCQRLNITSLAALEDADWKELKEQEDPSLELTEEEKAQLTQEAFEDFRDRIKKAGRGVIRKGPVHRTQHLLFLSHYKVEAGTEAALMRSELEQLMSEDPCSLGRHFDVPVFLDSEDLTDLHILQERVTSSHNLVLLLTKDVFTRPWVLVEIVTSIRWCIPVLLVTVEKAGSKFEFPTDSFFDALSAGNQLTKQDHKVLSECGIPLEEVVQSLKIVLKRIAVPYSPHKSGVIRRAELQALLEEASLREEPQGHMPTLCATPTMNTHG